MLLLYGLNFVFNLSCLDCQMVSIMADIFLALLILLVVTSLVQHLTASTLFGTSSLQLLFLLQHFDIPLNACWTTGC